METADYLMKFVLAFVLGGVLGLEREVNEKNSIGLKNTSTALLGLRTFSLVSVLGLIVGFLYQDFLILSAILAFAFFLFLTVFYFLDTQRTKDPGITTELALIYSFLIGLLLAVDLIPIQVTLAVTVVIILLLSQKTQIKKVVARINKNELNAFISFAVIAVAILPFLPNTTYSLSDIKGIDGFVRNLGINFQNISRVEIINPFKLWLIMALITGVDLIGYALERTIGKKGWLLASAAGGFISSTATTLSLAQESKHISKINHLVIAAIIANMVSFFQISFIIGAVNLGLLLLLLPSIAGMIIVSAILSVFFILLKEKKPKRSEEKPEETAETKIIDLSAAFKFITLFVFITILSKIALTLFGTGGFLAATALGSFVGLDAVMINTSELAGGKVDYGLAIVAFIVANAINLYSKSVYSFIQGKREFALKFLVSMTFVVLASMVSLILTLFI